MLEILEDPIKPIQPKHSHCLGCEVLLGLIMLRVLRFLFLLVPRDWGNPLYSISPLKPTTIRHVNPE